MRPMRVLIYTSLQHSPVVLIFYKLISSFHCITACKGRALTQAHIPGDKQEDYVPWRDLPLLSSDWLVVRGRRKQYGPIRGK